MKNADQDRIVQDALLLRALITRLTTDCDVSHAISIAASLFGSLLLDLRNIYGEEAGKQIAEQVLDKLYKDVREKREGIQNISIEVRKRQ